MTKIIGHDEACLRGAVDTEVEGYRGAGPTGLLLAAELRRRAVDWPAH
ncbi:MAG: hypothetical protein U1E25_15740 [Methylocystis sp.]